MNKTHKLIVAALLTALVTLATSQPGTTGDKGIYKPWGCSNIYNRAALDPDTGSCGRDWVGASHCCPLCCVGSYTDVKIWKDL